MNTEISTEEQPAKNEIIKFTLRKSKYSKLQKSLKKITFQKKSLLKEMEAINKKQKKLLKLVEKLEKNYDLSIGIAGSNNIPSANSENQNELMNATKQMQETQMSFNLQFLQLQSQMQHENRAYTAVSNIMKTKHDTVKNSISNIR